MLSRILRWLFGNSPARTSPQPGSQPSSTTDRDYDNSSAAKTASRERPSRNVSGLVTERFAPLTTEDALEQTSAADWKTAYWDSLSVIPSADLPRIKVIDRTMVGMGLITPEQLAEIHDVGQQMHLYENVEAWAEAAAATAVQQSRQERNERKEQKRQEAAERRERRQQLIEQRFASDITFLGRGVSRGLADRRSNLEKLRAARLPVLCAPADVAEQLELSIPTLRWLAFHNEAPTQVHYFYFRVPKKSGGTRLLSSPHRKLAGAQSWILQNILNSLPVHEAAHGFAQGRSVVSNAAPHVGAEVVVNTDLKDFFPTITFARVDGLFRSLGYSPAVATILALLCTEAPRLQMEISGQQLFAATGPRSLPQGACTSPAISNLICRNLDRRMTAMSQQLGWTYTRYADDITWSTRESASPSIGYILARIRHMADDEGFEVNESKTRVLRPSQRQTVTGVVVNERLGVPRKTVRRIRAILHNARRTGLAAQNTDGHAHFEAWLRGMIAWISMVNPDQGRKLSVQFAELQPD